MELNPNHPTTRAVSDHWHKICLLVMRKLGVTEVAISKMDIEDALEGKTNIVVQDGRNHDDLLHVYLVDDAEAKRLLRQEGGRPT